LGVELADLIPSRKARPVSTEVKRALERKFPQSADIITKAIERSKKGSAA